MRVIFTAEIVCEQCDSEIEIVTDGLRLWAEGSNGFGALTVSDPIERDGTVLTVPCPAYHEHRDEPCGYAHYVDLSANATGSEWHVFTDDQAPEIAHLRRESVHVVNINAGR